MLLYGEDKAIARWVGQILEVTDWGPCTAIGVVREGRIVAGCVYHMYRHPAVEISFAAKHPRWASKDAIRGILRYPFLQLNVRRVTALTPEHRTQAIAFMERLGFTREGYHPEAELDGSAVVSLGLLRKDAERWF